MHMINWSLTNVLSLKADVLAVCLSGTFRCLLTKWHNFPRMSFSKLNLTIHNSIVRKPLNKYICPAFKAWLKLGHTTGQWSQVYLYIYSRIVEKEKNQDAAMAQWLCAPHVHTHTHWFKSYRQAKLYWVANADTCKFQLAIAGARVQYRNMTSFLLYPQIKRRWYTFHLNHLLEDA